MTRAAHAVGTRRVQKLQEIAREGSTAARRKLQGRRTGECHRQRRHGMTFAQAGKKAIELGGKYDGHEAAGGRQRYTKHSVTELAGQGLMASAHDAYSARRPDAVLRRRLRRSRSGRRDRQVPNPRYLAIADVGTVINPRSLEGRARRLDARHRPRDRPEWVYDQHYGVPLAKRFYQNKPLTILDKPIEMKWAAVDIPDPETPVGARGIGEPPVGAGLARH